MEQRQTTKMLLLVYPTILLARCANDLVIFLVSLDEKFGLFSVRAHFKSFTITNVYYMFY